MIPLRDANPTRRRPVVTYALIAICVAVFGLELWIQSSEGDRALERFLTEYGAVASRITEAPASSALLGLITSQFLHGGWIHLGGNMLYLWIFGNNVEDRLGRFGYLLFYLAGGVVAGLTQVLIDPHSTNPLIGASGAIAAVLGAYLVLFPGARVLSLVFLGFFYQLINVPALVVLVLWFGLQLLSGFMSLGAGSAVDAGVAVFAHIGGFVAGVLVGLVVRGAGGRPGRDTRPSRFGVG
ncbi:MAG TPA: rhomboid family intramembrane serine protease [Candidatus Limnocylindrales bacterium]|nr:rhomboid family intramembrane serine protease [Candidatus Limnocylindrales bacterium]